MEKSPNHSSPALEEAWGRYREFAAASRKCKSRLINSRRNILILGILGALFGLLCQETIRLSSYIEFLSTASGKNLPMIFGGLSSLSLGLATYLGKEMISPEQERDLIRSRSIAEALKAMCYNFVMAVPPFSGSGKEPILLDKMEKFTLRGNDISLPVLTPIQKSEGIISSPMGVDKYIQERIENQIDFYNTKSKQYTSEVKKYRKYGLILGIIAVVLGAFGTTGWTAGWLAVISTITSSIVAYIYANRYQYMIVSYRATANRLSTLLSRWKISERAKEDNIQLVLECENAISVENSSWMAEIVSTDPK